MTGDKVCVVGIWHLGGVVSTCLADLGYTVTGVESDPAKMKALNKGVPPLFEPGLGELMGTNIKADRLSFTTNLDKATKDADYVLITFDTPVNEQDEVDLSDIFATASGLAGCLKENAIIIVSSQVPVGTCDKIRSQILKENPNASFDIAYSPENLRLGKAIDCFKRPERIVIGADSQETLDRAEEFFSVVKAPALKMSLRSAEMTKHALNAFLATSISFGNEIANLCDEVGADAVMVATALKSDGRIGKGIPLFPGLGFAGGTLARDIKVLRNLGDNVSYDTALLDGVLMVNERQNDLVARKLEKLCGGINHKNIGVLGLTYKPGTSTLRRSAAIEIISDITGKGATVKAYDPKAAAEEVRLHQEFEFCPDPYSIAQDSDALVLITEWPEMRELDFDRIKSVMKNPVLVDTKNFLDGQALTDKGFLYSGVGRGAKDARN